MACAAACEVGETQAPGMVRGCATVDLRANGRWSGLFCAGDDGGGRKVLDLGINRRASPAMQRVL